MKKKIKFIILNKLVCGDFKENRNYGNSINRDYDTVYNRTSDDVSSNRPINSI